ncbi:hypothetical protein DM02DRAFT_215133 [Periconia macrospinosa]|uniref:Zn(2)-C6 fungal-type domain-containing protein n=1 Tax=Periconia macrospinosa TaxID=97972 RepID=A0A2V1D997_9PLEO|nr:hypothetical protein DM02DRAFT_215133 [Periconia macrospinosa]
MIEQQPAAGVKHRSRAAYSRLICLGCRERRIRCELPSEVDVPEPGELRTVHTPCYRCRRLGVPCVVRQTVLGRPGHDSKPNADAHVRPPVVGTSNVVSHIIIELPSRPAARAQSKVVPYETRAHAHARAGEVNSCVVPQATRLESSFHPLLSQEDVARDTLLYHKPLSTETFTIIRSLDIIRFQRVEREWFRHLPARVGNTQALTLSCKAMVAACAYARGEPKLTVNDCYRALALALHAVVRLNFEQSSYGHFDDDMLACTALLAHLEGVINKHGIPTRLHVRGLAAILAARPPTYPVTQLARQIFDFHVCDAAIMACIQGTASPFESVPGVYYEKNRRGWRGDDDDDDSDRAQLKALGSELFVRIPRLVGLVRSQRLQRYPLPDAFTLLESLLSLQDSRAEARLLQAVVTVRPSSSSPDDQSYLLRQSLEFACVDDFEALIYYWQNRLALLRLERRFRHASATSSIQTNNTTEDPATQYRPQQTKEIFRLVKNIVMSIEYFTRLPLRKHQRLSAHAMVAVWGACTDWPSTFINVQKPEETRSLGELLLRRVNVGLGRKPDFTAAGDLDLALDVKDMDLAADMFVGGPLKGRFIELYCRAS